MRCGRPEGDGDHAGCHARAGYDPPRFCPQCARRMVVQVTPSSWSARCSAHGGVDRAQRRV
ncbi:MAG: biotin synthase auxiliary protein BsaP [Pseudonocardiales bacterium]